MLNKDNEIQILNQTDEEGIVNMAAELFAGLFLRQWEYNNRKEKARSPNHESCEDRLNSNIDSR
jgi:hypothetical protein